MQKIYLIRHGQTYFNIEGRIAGQIETNLTEIGKKQALDCALNLKNNNVKFDAILCSTLQRAKDTASIIASIIPSPIVENDDCKEFSNGIFEGIKAEDLQKRFSILLMRHRVLNLKTAQIYGQHILLLTLNTIQFHIQKAKQKHMLAIVL